MKCRQGTVVDRRGRWFSPAALLAVMATGLAVVAWIPLLAFLIKACTEGAWDWAATWSPRVVGLACGSAWTALVSALGVVVLGVGLCEALERRPTRERFYWLGAYGLAALVSPYIVVQGWINLWGHGGWLRGFVGLAKSERLTLFSPAGSMLMHLLLWLPLGVVLLWVARTDLAEKHEAFFRLYPMSWWREASLRYRAKYLIGAVLAGLYTFVTVFWSYEVPSILSQPSLAMEVMAAFGSFYDYRAVAVLVLPPLVAILILGAAAYPLLRKEGLIWRRAAGDHPSKCWAVAVLGLPLVLGLGFCAIGLLSRLTQSDAIGPALALAGPDFVNTVVVALGAGFLLGLAGMASGLGWRLSGRTWCRAGGTILAVVVLAVPPVVTGIGWVHLYGTVVFAAAPHNVFRLVMVDTVLFLPLALLLGYVATAGWTEAWNLELAQFGRQASALGMATRLYLGRWLLLAAAGGAWSAREVAASLLNYPPGGSTLAVTIETMLHFEQATALSALSLAQLMVVVVLWACGLAGYRYLSTRWI